MRFLFSTLANGNQAQTGSWGVTLAREPARCPPPHMRLHTPFPPSRAASDGVPYAMDAAPRWRTSCTEAYDPHAIADP